jgi:hypothetical protein
MEKLTTGWTNERNRKRKAGERRPGSKCTKGRGKEERCREMTIRQANEKQWGKNKGGLKGIKERQEDSEE